mgnify:CR=1 FL=1
MKKYALLMGDEDGNCFKPLTQEEVNDLAQTVEDYGIQKFIEKHENEYPENWSDDEAVLIEYEVKMPRKVEIVTKLEI